MGGKASAPKPDPRMADAALRQIALNEQMYADYRAQDMPWIRSIAEESLGISRDNAQRAQALADYQLEAMRRNDQRYWSTAVPFEDELIADSRRFDSQTYKDMLVDQALADVGMSFSNARAQGLRAMNRMGINPVSGKYNDGNVQTSLAQANAYATAANKTRQAADQIGLATKMQMYGGLRGLAGLGATNAQLGISSMGATQGAVGGMLGSTGAYTSANNAALNAYNSGMASGITGLGNYTSLQQNAAKINNDADPFASLLGAATQIGLKFIP